MQVRLGFSSELSADVRSTGKHWNFLKPSPCPALSRKLEVISLIVCREVCWFRGERFSCVVSCSLMSLFLDHSFAMFLPSMIATGSVGAAVCGLQINRMEGSIWGESLTELLAKITHIEVVSVPHCQYPHFSCQTKPFFRCWMDIKWRRSRISIHLWLNYTCKTMSLFVMENYSWYWQLAWT